MRSETDLPAIFTNQERYCYKWLYDCGVKGWLVDMLKKSVVWVDSQDRLHKFDSLVCFAKSLGCKIPPPKEQP